MSGIAEPRYRCAQRRIKLDESMFGGEGTRAATIAALMHPLPDPAR